MSNTARAALLAVSPNGPQPLVKRDRTNQPIDDSQRANYAPAADAIADLPPKLAPQSVQDAEIMAEAFDMYPSLTPRKKVVYVPFSLRLSPEADAALDEICADRRVDKSAVVRDAIDQLIRNVASRKTPQSGD